MTKGYVRMPELVVGRITYGGSNQQSASNNIPDKALNNKIVNDTSQLQAKREAWPMMYLGEKPEGVVEFLPIKSRVEQLLEDTLQEVEELKAQLEYEKTKNGAYRKLARVKMYLAEGSDRTLEEVLTNI